ncbi:MAG: twin-arginine translocation signal domain-containing protein, partial [Myxococcota bacterium]
MKPSDLENEERTPAVSRRDFIKVCTAAAAAVGLSASVGKAWAEELAKGRKPSVIWLHFQECTGCTESLLRTSHPDVGELILDLISLDYHETLFAASGHQIEGALHDAIKENAGKYILVVEGAIPTKLSGNYCVIAGKTARDSLKECADKAALIVAIGS